MEIPQLLKNKSLIWSTVGILVLIIGVIVALQLIPQEQDLREEAATSSGTTQVRIDPTSMQLATNEEKPATVKVNTMNLGVRGMSAVLSYPYVGSTPSLTAKDLTILAPFNAAPWVCNIKDIVTENQQVIISVSCNLDPIAVPAGYRSNSQFVDFFKFNLKAGTTATTLPISITFNNSDTIMTRIDAGNSEDIAAIPTTSLRVTIAQGSGTSSPSPTPTTTPTATTNTKRLELSLNDLACGANDFTAKAKAVDASTTNLSGIGVTFTYNGETKNATTNSSAEAEVKFTRAATNLEVKVEAGAFESDTATATLPTGCTSSSTTPTPTASTTTVGASCNQTCSASRDCQSGLSCVTGYCRAAQCSSDTSCGCADVDVAAQNGTTELPESGFDQTLAMTILGLLFLLGGGQLLWNTKHRTEEVETQDQP